jgi:hypothetical protein
MWLGHLEAHVSKWGHNWVLRTLRADEELVASLIAKEYQDSLGQVKAYAWAHLAAAIVAVDGDDNYCPSIGPNIQDNVRAKFNWMTENWYWPIGEFLFGHYTELLSKQAEALDAVDSLSQRSLRTSWPSRDSLNEQGDSLETSTESNSGLSPISSEQMKTLADKPE